MRRLHIYPLTAFDAAWHVPGMNIAAYRDSRGITQAELAAELSVTQSTVARWEAGSMPARDMLARIAEITGGQVMPNDWIDIPAVASQDAAA
jgi:transcriptional regulator with XRE-family HTH domain